MKNHGKEVLGAKAAYIPFKKKMTQVDINSNQQQDHINCRYTKSTTLKELKGIENLCKQTELRYMDGRDPSHKFTSLLRELRYGERC